jgi:hypothetical protein
LRHLSVSHIPVVRGAKQDLKNNLASLPLLNHISDLASRLPLRMHPVPYLNPPSLGFKCLFCSKRSKQSRMRSDHIRPFCSDEARAAANRGEPVIEQCFLQQFGTNASPFYVEVFADDLMDLDMVSAAAELRSPAVDPTAQGILSTLIAKEKARAEADILLAQMVPAQEVQGQLPPFLEESSTSPS